MEALNWLEQYDVSRHNIANMSAAKLGVVVLGALGGKKVKATVDDFLPFDTRRIKKDTGITKESLTVFRHLMKSRRMDGRVIALLADDLKLNSNREEEE